MPSTPLRPKRMRAEHLELATRPYRPCADYFYYSRKQTRRPGSASQECIRRERELLAHSPVLAPPRTCLMSTIPPSTPRCVAKGATAVCLSWKRRGRWYGGAAEIMGVHHFQPCGNDACDVGRWRRLDEGQWLKPAREGLVSVARIPRYAELLRSARLQD